MPHQSYMNRLMRETKSRRRDSSPPATGKGVQHQHQQQQRRTSPRRHSNESQSPTPDLQQSRDRSNEDLKKKKLDMAPPGSIAYRALKALEEEASSSGSSDDEGDDDYSPSESSAAGDTSRADTSIPPQNHNKNNASTTSKSSMRRATKSSSPSSRNNSNSRRSPPPRSSSRYVNITSQSQRKQNKDEKMAMISRKLHHFTNINSPPNSSVCSGSNYSRRSPSHSIASINTNAGNSAASNNGNAGRSVFNLEMATPRHKQSGGKKGQQSSATQGGRAKNNSNNGPASTKAVGGMGVASSLASQNLNNSTQNNPLAVNVQIRTDQGGLTQRHKKTIKSSPTISTLFLAALSLCTKAYSFINRAFFKSVSKAFITLSFASFLK